MPYVSELPTSARRSEVWRKQRNDIAMLILVRPEIVLPPAKAVFSANAGPQGETPAAQAASLKSPGYALPATACRPMKAR